MLLALLLSSDGGQCRSPHTCKMLCDLRPAVPLHLWAGNEDPEPTSRTDPAGRSPSLMPSRTRQKPRTKKRLVRITAPGPAGVGASPGDPGPPVRCSFHCPVQRPSHFSNLKAERRCTRRGHTRCGIVSCGRGRPQPCRAPQSPHPLGTRRPQGHLQPKGKVNLGLGPLDDRPDNPAPSPPAWGFSLVPQPGPSSNQVPALSAQPLRPRWPPSHLHLHCA